MKFNKDSHVFTILFLFISTVILVFPLTLAYVGTKPIADNYWRIQHVVKTLNSLGIPADAKKSDEALAEYKTLTKYTVGTMGKDSAGHPQVTFGRLDYNAIAQDPSKLQLLEVDDTVIDKALQDNSYTGNIPVFFYSTTVDGQKRFAGDFTGPGLWGNVSLSVGVNADGSQIIGTQVLFNVETPGLGGRIGEPWFTNQFAGLKPASTGLVFNQSGQKAPNGFDAIAGATITSTAVRDIINNHALVLLKAFIAQMGGKS